MTRTTAAIAKVRTMIRTAHTSVVATRAGAGFIVLAGLVAGASPVVRAQAGNPPSAQELANQANNPAAPLTLIQVRDILLPDVEHANGATNALQLQPVLPIGPFKSAPFVQLMKLTLPIVLSLPDPISRTGLGDLEVFDLVSIKESWGRWGFGPALTFPTASDRVLGGGKWQAGPAVAAIYTGIRNLTAGAILQNPISYAGSSDRSDVNNLIITPTFTLNLEKGWFVGLSDYELDFRLGGRRRSDGADRPASRPRRSSRAPARQHVGRGWRQCGAARPSAEGWLDSRLRIQSDLQLPSRSWRKDQGAAPEKRGEVMTRSLLQACEVNRIGPSGISEGLWHQQP